ncbi:hypothetical protein [Antrihabitans cavernicola]|uniref:Uncharacterized protein n=1 Tax=Antrihabitans cavernicola TaxID=2495913 RepID=A0A5A7S3W3_9NOCA|nr:hypothetical protein [Spelaeibacter cavernicola]KAA0016343.1 hypothetical protein FOY51_26345 [Spelaeibacter cavernicola]
MTVIADIKDMIANLELAGHPDVRVSRYSALEILQPDTLAVIVLSKRHSALIEKTIRRLVEQTTTEQHYASSEITVRRDVITIRIALPGLPERATPSTVEPPAETAATTSTREKASIRTAGPANHDGTKHYSPRRIA